MNLENFLLVFVIAFLVLAILCLPLLWQIWRTMKNATETLETLNQSLPAILKNIEEITGNINNSAATINNEVQTLSSAVNRFYSATSGIIGDVRSLSPLAAKKSFLQLIDNGLAIIKGMRVFLDIFLHKK